MWVSSSHCNNSACVQWHKSSFSNPSGNSVEHSVGAKFEEVRDSKQNSWEYQPILGFTPEEWDGGRVIRFHPVPVAAVPARLRAGRKPESAWFAVWDSRGGILLFDDEEKLAWENGVRNGEFTRETVSA